VFPILLSKKIINNNKKEKSYITMALLECKASIFYSVVQVFFS